MPSRLYLSLFSVHFVSSTHSVDLDDTMRYAYELYLKLTSPLLLRLDMNKSFGKYIESEILCDWSEPVARMNVAFLYYSKSTTA